jgi:cation diffusion facilitator CzcD-associated flavoprotein CzcO
MKTCVIGGGSSGMVAVKALADAGQACDCFEETGELGGLWVYGNGRSTAYSSLSINTSRGRMQYADFPMPESYPDYPGHALIADYFRAYARHFGLARHVRFHTRVEQVARQADGAYRVTTSDGTTATYGSVVVANGHHRQPYYPQPPFPGHFDGITLHSSEYRSPSEPYDLRERSVVVLGFGNSAVDIACELATTGRARRVLLATRRGAWVLPKYVLGRPVDQLRVGPSFLPARFAAWLSELLYPLVIADLEALGLPKPDHHLGHAHPTLSSELLPLVKAGRVIPKPNLRALSGRDILFADDTRERVDALVYATGYEVTFPFFDPAFVAAPENELPLYYRTLHPEHAGLYFIGLAQPLGAIMPIAEAQAKLVADCITGRYAPPPTESMQRAAREERASVARRFVPTRRHTMQVDFDAFMAALAAEHRAGRQRALEQARSARRRA